MLAFLDSFSNIEKIFVLCAAVGGLLFLIRTIMQFLGVDGGEGMDGIDGEASLMDSDGSFTILSFQGITAFFMTFGISGLALVRENHLAIGYAIPIAFIIGFVSMFIIAKIFSSAKNLTSSGTTSIKNAIGEEGTVYLTIAAEGTGKASVTVQGSLRTYDAQSEKKEELKTGQRIRVTDVIGSTTLVVDKI